MTIYGLAAGRGAYSRPENSHTLMLGYAHETPPYEGDLQSGQDIIEPDFRCLTGERAISLISQINDFSPTLAECGWPTKITSGFYATTPDGVPFIGRDSNVLNLVHAAGFSGHGLMHAPVTALLVKEIIGRAEKSVYLPYPYNKYFLSLDTFSPDREITEKEKMVI